VHFSAAPEFKPTTKVKIIVESPTSTSSDDKQATTVTLKKSRKKTKESMEEKDEKILAICLADPRWMKTAESFNKIKGKGVVKVQLMAYLRALLNPTELREISELMNQKDKVCK
jgi:hypothetical protein